MEPVGAIQNSETLKVSRNAGAIHIANLEQSTREATCRQLTDAERAVRLVHILNNPERSAEHAPLRALLKRLMRRNVLL